jgi:HTH-type transcriptional regulator / antitoxin HigA
VSDKYTFRPDYVVPPGATLRETLDVKGITQADLAARTGLAEKTISQIVNGIAPITYETSEKLELALGIPASFWNQRETTYRAGLLRVEENKRHEASIEWLKEIPIKPLLQLGLLQKTKDKAELVRQLLRFFGVSSVDAWRETWKNVAVSFRGGDAAIRRLGYAATWLRLGELVAEKKECRPFDAPVFRNALAEVRSLTILPIKDWWPRLPAICADAGVVVAVIPEITGASISGAARWLSPAKVLIQLSFKYKSDDQFWFSFFHESGHILLHGKKAIFIEDGRRDSKEELEADYFASEFLIPKQYRSRLPLLRNRASIVAFAQEIGVSPGIVVGRLHHDKLLDPSHCRDLKVKYEWVKPKVSD